MIKRQKLIVYKKAILTNKEIVPFPPKKSIYETNNLDHLRGSISIRFLQQRQKN